MLREILRGMATFFFVVSSLITIIIYSGSRTEFRYCYALGLLFFGFGVLFISQGMVESRMELIGRITRYIGGIYVLFAVISYYRLIKKQR